MCLFQKNGLWVQEESALSSTSFITRSTIIAETGDPIVLLVFTCAVYSHLCMFYIQVTESRMVCLCVHPCVLDGVSVCTSMCVGWCVCVHIHVCWMVCVCVHPCVLDGVCRGRACVV